MCAADKKGSILYELSGATNELARGETPKSKKVLVSNECMPINLRISTIPKYKKTLFFLNKLDKKG
ncbi:hypothetical protein ACT7DB_20270 [Bacillus cereus]